VQRQVDELVRWSMTFTSSCTTSRSRTFYLFSSWLAFTSKCVMIRHSKSSCMVKRAISSKVEHSYDTPSIQRISTLEGHTHPAKALIEQAVKLKCYLTTRQEERSRTLHPNRKKKCSGKLISKQGYGAARMLKEPIKGSGRLSLRMSIPESAKPRGWLWQDHHVQRMSIATVALP